ncbi:MAG: hypothetical protein HYX87_06575 [Chloroflexi bacterium]|nr:hypothetical protein [Chloroflexota bacterium]
MLLEGKFIVKAPIQRTWDFLLDPVTLFSCVPGAEKIERLDDKTYNCVIKQKVGPIGVKFKFKTLLTKVEAPKHLEFSGEGEEVARAGHFVQKSSVDLVEIPGGVEVTYRSEVSISGRLATFGDRIMRAKAKSVQEELSRNLDAKLKELS